MPTVKLSRPGALKAFLRHEQIGELDAQLSNFGYDASRIFFKCISNDAHDAYRQVFDKERIILRNGGDGPLIREFHQLSKMHTGNPENTAMPVALTMMDSKCVGYFSEYVKGVTIDKTFDHSDRHIRLLEGAFEAVSVLHRKGIGHGDINQRNIIVGVGDGIKLVDPLVPYEGCSDEELIADDRIDLAGILSGIRYLKRKSCRIVGEKIAVPMPAIK